MTIIYEHYSDVLTEILPTAHVIHSPATETSKVEQFIADLRGGAVFPPIELHRDANGCFLRNGAHRLAAHRALDRACPARLVTEIPLNIALANPPGLCARHPHGCNLSPLPPVERERSGVREACAASAPSSPSRAIQPRQSSAASAKIAPEKGAQ